MLLRPPPLSYSMLKWERKYSSFVKQGQSASVFDGIAEGFQVQSFFVLSDFSCKIIMK
jgi:hypothetical protein